MPNCLRTGESKRLAARKCRISCIVALLEIVDKTTRCRCDSLCTACVTCQVGGVLQSQHGGQSCVDGDKDAADSDHPPSLPYFISLDVWPSFYSCGKWRTRSVATSQPRTLNRDLSLYSETTRWRVRSCMATFRACHHSGGVHGGVASATYFHTCSPKTCWSRP